MDNTLLENYITAYREKKDADDRVKELNRKHDALKQALIDAMFDEGVTSIKKDGVTLSLSQRIWASAPDIEGTNEKDSDALTRGLLAIGADHLVKTTVNSISLSSFISDVSVFPLDDEGMPTLPPELAGRIKITREPNISVRGAR
jgi:hypothetical protein